MPYRPLATASSLKNPPSFRVRRSPFMLPFPLGRSFSVAIPKSLVLAVAAALLLGSAGQGSAAEAQETAAATLQSVPVAPTTTEKPPVISGASLLRKSTDSAPSVFQSAQQNAPSSEQTEATTSAPANEQINASVSESVPAPVTEPASAPTQTTSDLSSSVEASSWSEPQGAAPEDTALDGAYDGVPPWVQPQAELVEEEIPDEDLAPENLSVDAVSGVQGFATPHVWPEPIDTASPVSPPPPVSPNASPAASPNVPTSAMGVEIQSEPREPLYVEPVDLPIPYTRFPTTNVAGMEMGNLESEHPVIRIGIEWVSEPSEELAAIRQSILMLEAKLPQYSFDVRVVKRSVLDAAFRQKTMDVFITETGFYLEGVSDGLIALASLVPPTAREPDVAYAGVVIVREDSPFQQLTDILGGPVATLAEEPLSGHLPVRAELAKATRFMGTLHGTHHYGEQRQLVADVQAGRYQAGIVRSCFLENILMREGEKALKGLRILSPVAEDGLACVHSTQAYPGWVMSFTPQVPSRIAKEIADVLLEDPMHINSAYWGITTDYSKSAMLLKTLKLGPYSYLSLTAAEGVLYTYRKEILAVLLVMVGLAAHGLLLRRLVKRRTRELEKLYERERAMKAEALETTRQLEALQRIGAVNQMSNVLTHELLQPLTSIRNLTRGAERTMEEDASQVDEILEALAQIEAQTQKASAIVERVRAYTKGRREKLGSSTREKLQLAQEVRRAVGNFKLSAKSQGVTIVLGPLAPITFEMELLDFELIILNLLSNAADATRERQNARVDVSLTVADATAESVAHTAAVITTAGETLATRTPTRTFTLTVSDNGGQLTDADLRRMEGSVLESTKPDGLGLGLTIIRHLASLTLGRVEFSRNRENGLTARVTWPLPADTPVPPPETWHGEAEAQHAEKDAIKDTQKGMQKGTLSGTLHKVSGMSPDQVAANSATDNASSGAEDPRPRSTVSVQSAIAEAAIPQ